MRKYLLAGVLGLSCMVCDAQFKRGDRMVGASVGSIFFNGGSATQTVVSVGSLDFTTRQFGVNISPSIGWFISEKTAVGLSVNINPTSNKTTYETNGSSFQEDQDNNFNIGFGGFGRNYFSSTGSFLPFGQLGINAGFNTRKTEGYYYGGSGSGIYKDTYTGKSSGGFFFNSTLNLGMTKMVGESTGLDIFVGYNFSYNKNTFRLTRLRDEGNNGSVESRSENETTTSFTNHGVVVGVGFQIFLRGKK